MNPDSSARVSSTQQFLANYWDILGGIIFLGLTLLLHFSHQTELSTLTSAIAIIFFSITVSEVAEILADRLGEPYGSYVLTITAVAVEIILLFNIMLQSTNSPEAMETVKGGIISAVIVDMNVLLGLAVFIGGLSFTEQQHNEDTSSSYTTILYVSSLALLVPSILGTSGDHDMNTIETASYLIGGLLFSFYLVILVFQTKTHTHFFKSTARSRMFRFKQRQEEGIAEEEVHHNYLFDNISTLLNFFAIFILIALIGILAEIFAHDGLKLFKEFGISAGLAGLTIAIISVSPEIFTAIRAAKNDQIQRVVNIAMGASTVSILITVPALLILGYASGNHLTLNFNPLEIGALVFTILLAWKTTDDGETNYFEGISHMMLFLAYAVIAGLY